MLSGKEKYYGNLYESGHADLQRRHRQLQHRHGRARAGPDRLENGSRIEGITVPAGGVITLVYTTRVNAFADPSAEGTIENTVTVTGGGLTDAVTATETLPAAAAAELRIVKALEPVRVSDSGTLTYTFTIENYGSADADAAAGVTVTDRFDPILRNIAVTYNSDAWLASNYTYDTATGLFRTVPAAITVPAASAVQDPETGVWTVRPGTVTLQITGTI